MMKSSDKYNQLKTTSLFVLLPMFLLFIACGKTEIMQEMKETTNIKSYVSKGDTMLYGLACDGCSDSVLVFLPDSGGDPINYSILEARLNHQVFGRPRIGDRMAVLVDTANPKALMLAINMEQVNGTWYYCGNNQMTWCTGGSFNGGDLGEISALYLGGQPHV